MKTQFQMLEWSLNLSSSLNEQIPDWVFDSMKTQDGNLPEIIFLNEVVTANDSCRKLLEQIEEEKYRIICSNNNHGNQVAIALSSDFKIKNIVYQVPYVQTYYAPDFLHVEAEYNGTLYNFVALRIRVGSHKSKDPEEYKNRYIQFQCYKHYISKLTNVISAGDFNNSRIIGNEEGLFEQSQKIYEDGNFLQRFYNYQKIRHEIESFTTDKKILTPENGSLYTSANKEEKRENLSSIGLKPYRNKTTNEIVFLHPRIDKNNFKIDHFVISESIPVLSNPYYDWRFLQNFINQKSPVSVKPKDYFYIDSESGEVTDNVKIGYPDHAQLRATISLIEK